MRTPTPRSRLLVPVIAGLVIAACLVALAWASQAWRLPLLLALGCVLGFALHHGHYGFTAAWRNALRGRTPWPMLSQFVLITLTSVLFLTTDALREGGLGMTTGPSSGVIVLGAFVFGIGMQLANGCGSGTLFTIGGGSTKMIVTLLFFVTGTVVGSMHLDWWLGVGGTPGLPAFLQSTLGEAVARQFRPEWLNLKALWGGWTALGVQTAVLAGVALAFWGWWRHVQGRQASTLGAMAAAPDKTSADPWRPRDLVFKSWPIWLTVLVIAAGAYAVKMLSGGTWSVTMGMTLWGAKVLDALGHDMTAYGFWARRETLLAAPLWTNVISLTNLGLILGATLSAGLLGSFRPTLRIPLGALLAAVIGGLMLGYGARLGFGCNIGAYYSGLASFSLHGWLWFPSALLGCLIGLRLRPLFGLD